MITPEKISNRAIKAIYRNQGIVVVQPYARLLHATKRFSPWILDRINHFSRRRLKISNRAPNRSGISDEMPRKAA